MVSLLSPTTIQSVQELKEEVHFNELGNLNDAVEPFTRLVSQSGRSVRLHCVVPTWSTTSDTCLDLHDLNDLRSRFLLFIHDLLESLRLSGIAASYRLAPSNSPSCFVCALRPESNPSTAKSAAFEVLQRAKLTKKEKVLLADLEQGPAVIIS